jgi:hypothetical protein
MISLKLLILPTALLLPLSVQAAEMSKSGTESITVTWVTTSSSSMKLGDRSFDTYEHAGVMRNAAGKGMFNNFAIRIVGSGETAGKDRIDRGADIFTDRDGDQIFDIWEGKVVEGGEAGTSKITGGTGKFAGISGTGEWSVVDYFIDSDDKRARGVVASKFTWKLP